MSKRELRHAAVELVHPCRTLYAAIEDGCLVAWVELYYGHPLTPERIVRHWRAGMPLEVAVFNSGRVSRLGEIPPRIVERYLAKESNP